VLYMVLENRLSAVSQEFWQAGLAAALVAVVPLVQRGRWDWVGMWRRVAGREKQA
jgi:cytochrome c-type biogenesis protein CcmH/NrfG